MMPRLHLLGAFLVLALSGMVFLLGARMRHLQDEAALLARRADWPHAGMIVSAGRAHQYLHGSLRGREAAVDSLRRFARGELSYVPPDPEPRRRYPR